jgi:hypothetical protein
LCPSINRFVANRKSAILLEIDLPAMKPTFVAQNMRRTPAVFLFLSVERRNRSKEPLTLRSEIGSSISAIFSTAHALGTERRRTE